MIDHQADKKKLVDEFLAKAKIDLDDARLLHQSGGHPENICYHSHQVVEKVFKALLIARTGNYLRTHELPLLLEKIGRIDSSLKQFQTEAELLSGYYIEGRYPIFPPEQFTRQQAKKALDQAQKIYKLVSQNLKQV